jgi:IS605 OrfB family transposase
MYNRSLEMMSYLAKSKIFPEFNILRDKHMRPKYLYHKHVYPEWYTGNKIPPRILDAAIIVAHQNFMSNLSKVKSGAIKNFTMKFKSKKDPTAILLDASVFSKKQNAFCVTVLGVIKSSESIIQPISHSSWLKYYPITGEYKLYQPRMVFVPPLPKTRQEIALDPGEKNFLVGFNPNQEIVKIGVMCRYRFIRLNKKISALSSKIDRLKNKVKKKYLRKRRKQLYERKQYLRDDLHWKTIAFLTDNYDTIVLGDMSTQAIARKIKNDRVKDTLMGLSPYLFKTRLEWKCNMTGRQFIYQDESYTTKTCSQCGNQSIPQDRTFKCSKCKIIFHRDVNGARNIWLRWRIQADKEWKKHLFNLNKKLNPPIKPRVLEEYKSVDGLLLARYDLSRSYKVSIEELRKDFEPGRKRVIPDAR